MPERSSTGSAYILGILGMQWLDRVQAIIFIIIISKAAMPDL